MTTAPFSHVMASLRGLGMTPAQVRALLPAWWEPAIANSSAGVWETSLLLARRLGLDANALSQAHIAPLPEITAPRFKHTVRVSADQLGPASMIATSLARAVVGAMPPRSAFRSRSADEVRRELLSHADARIDFDRLVDYCWRQGVPVIPLPNLPKGLRKMDAAAIKVGARPVIVIARKSDSKAWLSFLLAHELGHVCLNHVQDNSALVEGSLTDTAEFDAQSQIDAQEQEANQFAHAILAGPEADRVVMSWSSRMAPIELASEAASASDTLACAPGHLLLRYAFLTHRWPEARMALRFHAEDMDAQVALIDRMSSELDASQVGDDMQDFVENVTGISARAA